MDPITNPTPTPNPVPGAAPATSGAVNPAAAAAPAVPGAASSMGGAAAPTPAPTPATAAGGITTPPVNPIIRPGGGTAVPGAPVAPSPVPNPTAPAPGGVPAAGGLAATDPIMMPEPAPEPDPIEEELKAPMKAAAPAPGSIGSAVSGPAADTPAEGASATAPGENPFEAKQTPSVAFNDPATQPDPAAAGATNMVPGKKKNNKVTLIALIAVAGVIVVVLAVILIMQLTSGSGTSTASESTVNPTPATPIDEPVDDEDEPTNGGDDQDTATITEDYFVTDDTKQVMSIPLETLGLEGETLEYAQDQGAKGYFVISHDDANTVTDVSLYIYFDTATAASEVYEGFAAAMNEQGTSETSYRLDGNYIVYTQPVSADEAVDLEGLIRTYEEMGATAI